MSTFSLTSSRLAGSMFWSQLPPLVLSLIYVGFSYAPLLVRSLIKVVFAVVYGLIGLREMLTKKSEEKSSGYIRLPQ